MIQSEALRLFAEKGYADTTVEETRRSVSSSRHGLTTSRWPRASARS
jgi:hypothetical protein